MQAPEHILLIADIEGSSGCWSRQGSKFMTRQWREACIGMSLDVDAVVRSLLSQGVKHIRVIDFHRTAYNLLPRLIDPRARISQGYSKGPIPGIGRVEGADAVIFIGMHAASGTSGFLAHTLTSRVAALKVNGRLFSELELFASVLAPFDLKPLFFSGCPIACDQARTAIPGIQTYEIDKAGDRIDFNDDSWRSGLARSAAEALQVKGTKCTDPRGLFQVEMQMHDRTAAARAAKSWRCDFDGDSIRFSSPDAADLFLKLIRLCYFSQLTVRFLGPGLFLYRLLGRLGWLTVWLAEKRKAKY